MTVETVASTLVTASVTSLSILTLVILKLIDRRENKKSESKDVDNIDLFICGTKTAILSGGAATILAIFVLAWENLSISGSVEVGPTVLAVAIGAFCLEVVVIGGAVIYLSPDDLGNAYES